jgi:hypothetical protein
LLVFYELYAFDLAEKLAQIHDFFFTVFLRKIAYQQSFIVLYFNFVGLSFALSQSLLDQTSTACQLLALLCSRIVRIEIWVSTEQLRIGWVDSLGVFGSANFEVIAFDLHLLEHEALRRFIRSSEVDKGIVAITAYPASYNWISALKYASGLAEVNKSLVQDLSKIFS